MKEVGVSPIFAAVLSNLLHSPQLLFSPPIHSLSARADSNLTHQQKILPMHFLFVRFATGCCYTRQEEVRQQMTDISPDNIQRDIWMVGRRFMLDHYF